MAGSSVAVFLFLTLPLGLWVTHRAFDLQEDWGFVAPATEDELDHAAKQLAASFPANDVEWVRRTVAAAANPCVCTLRCPQGGVPNAGPSKGGKGGRDASPGLYLQLCGSVTEAREAQRGEWMGRKGSIADGFWDVLAELVWWPEVSRGLGVGIQGYRSCARWARQANDGQDCGPFPRVACDTVPMLGWVVRSVGVDVCRAQLGSADRRPSPPTGALRSPPGMSWMAARYTRGVWVGVGG